MNADERMAKSLIWKPATLRKRSKSQVQLERFIKLYGCGARVKDVIKASRKP